MNFETGEERRSYKGFGGVAEQQGDITEKKSETPEEQGDCYLLLANLHLLLIIGVLKRVPHGNSQNQRRYGAGDLLHNEEESGMAPEFWTISPETANLRYNFLFGECSR